MVIDDDAPLLGFTAKYLARLVYSISACGSSEQAWREFNAMAETVNRMTGFACHQC